MPVVHAQFARFDGAAIIGMLLLKAPAAQLTVDVPSQLETLIEEAAAARGGSRPALPNLTKRTTRFSETEEPAAHHSYRPDAAPRKPAMRRQASMPAPFAPDAEPDWFAV